MPPSGYLTAQGINAAIQHLGNTYSAICSIATLPENSHEGRPVRSLKIASGSGTDRRGVLFLGGVHARELINPDLLLSLAQRLCDAYTNNTGLSFGPQSYAASTIKLIVESLDIFMIPLVNPDGRRYVQQPNGDPWWRKNRAPNPGLMCQGVDLNRNCDFLHSSGIGTSGDSCHDVFKGPNAFSEPETRNVRHILDAQPNIGYMVDVHSFSELILHSWGDDDNQTTDPAMSFANPAFDGLRGTPGDSLYKEYIPAADQDWLVNTGLAMRDAIAAVRGRLYTAKQSVLLYPTSGTTKDYAYSRHFVDASKRKVYGYTLETAREFQPPYTEALAVIDEASSGLIQFCMSALCAAETTAATTTLSAKLTAMRKFRDSELLTREKGRRYAATLQRHNAELVALLAADDGVRKDAGALLSKLLQAAQPAKGKPAKAVDAALINAFEKAADSLGERASKPLKKTLKELRSDLAEAKGRKLDEILGPRDG